MPDQYSIEEFAAKIKERRSDLADVPAMILVGKTLAAAPELKQYLKPAEQPVSTPNPPLYARTPMEVAQDQAAHVLSGIPTALTGIPSFLKNAASAAYDIATGQGTGKAQAMVKGTAEPFITPAKQAIELAKPGLVNAPSPDAPETAQAAENAGGVLGGAILAGVAPHLAKPLSKARSLASDALQSMKDRISPPQPPAPPLDAPAVNKWMNVAAKQVEHGANPGAQLIQENLIGSTKEATKANVKSALASAGQDLEKSLNAADATGKVIDAQTPVYDSAAKAVKIIGKSKDTAFNEAVSNIVDDIETRHPALNSLKPSDAHALKVDLGDSINWHGEAFDEPLNQVKVRIYRALNNDLKSIPDVGPIQDRWGNLYIANKSLKGSIAKDIVGSGTGTAPLMPQPSAPLASPGWRAVKVGGKWVLRRLPYALAGAEVMRELTKE